MARRSDHSRPELERLIVLEGHRHMADVGFARFSAREVAKRIGYSIGTIYNVFGSYDSLILAINARTITLWSDHLRGRLADCDGDRLECLVRSYFEFARDHRQAWSAIYDHRLPPDETPPEWYWRAISELIGIVDAEVAARLPHRSAEEAHALARSLLAAVHGHCVFDMTGTFALLGEARPVEAAVALVHGAVAAAATG